MLSKYLGTKRSYNKKRAEQTEDVLEATKLLIKRYSNTLCYSIRVQSAKWAWALIHALIKNYRSQTHGGIPWSIEELNSLVF